MKFKKVIAEKAPKVKNKWAVQLGVVGAALMAGFALLQLFRFDKFLPELNAQLPGGHGFAIFVGVVVVVAEIFAIPFLLRMKLSRLARFCSGLLVFVPAWIWLIVAIWSTGTSVVAVQFSTYFPLDSGVWLIVFNTLWLAFNFWLAWQLGLGDLKLTDKKLKKTKK